MIGAIDFGQHSPLISLTALSSPSKTTLLYVITVPKIVQLHYTNNHVSCTYEIST